MSTMITSPVTRSRAAAAMVAWWLPELAAATVAGAAGATVWSPFWVVCAALLLWAAARETGAAVHAHRTLTGRRPQSRKRRPRFVVQRGRTPHPRRVVVSR